MAADTTSTANVPKTIKLKKGKSKTLKCGTGKNIYRSSNSRVAKVSKKGKITAKAKGKAVITVKKGTKTMKCKVVVK